MLLPTHRMTTAATVSTSVLVVNQFIEPVSLVTGLTVLAGATFGAQLPDIDHHKSAIGKTMPLLSRFIRLFGHRSITHTIWAVLLLAIGTYFIPYPWIQTLCIGITVGYFCHIWQDSFSPMGVYWFAPPVLPFQKKKQKQKARQKKKQTGYKKRRRFINFDAWYSPYYRVDSPKEQRIFQIMRIVFIITSAIYLWVKIINLF